MSQVGLIDLPNELIVLILIQLNKVEIALLNKTCKDMYYITNIDVHRWNKAAWIIQNMWFKNYCNPYTLIGKKRINTYFADFNSVMN